MSPKRSETEQSDLVPRDLDPFYVGYLPTPPRHRAVMIMAIILIAIWGLLTSLLLVLAQRSPGEAVWDISNEKTWSGLLTDDPYPILITQTDTLLVVNMGKTGAHEQLEPFFGTQITLSGYELQREGRRMIELSPDGIKPSSAPIAVDLPMLEVLDDQPTLHTGEIIDGKCFLGAMKPGDGFAHRSCAILCLKGGLPPMFAPDGLKEGQEFPLVILDGKAILPEDLHRFVACRVELQAHRAQFGSIPLLLIVPESIRVLEHTHQRSRGLLIETAGG